LRISASLSLSLSLSLFLCLACAPSLSQGALGRPAPKDLRRPRQLVKIEKRDEISEEAKAAGNAGNAGNGSDILNGSGGNGLVGKVEGAGAALVTEIEETDARGVPAQVSTLPRAVFFFF
jgi:hypothetical protein